MSISTTPPSRISAFTLVELMITLVVLGLITSLVAPRILGMGEYYLDKATREMGGAMQGIYQRAIIKGAPYIMKINLDERKYTVYTCPKDEAAPQPADEGSSTSAGALLSKDKAKEEAEAENANPDVDLKVTVDGKEDEINVEGKCRIDDEMEGNEVVLPEGVSFKALKLGHRGETPVTSGADVIVFFPVGFMTKASIYLTDDNDNGSAIVVNPLTGTVRVYDEWKDLEGAEDLPSPKQEESESSDSKGSDEGSDEE